MNTKEEKKELTYEMVMQMFAESREQSEKDWKKIKEQMKETNKKFQETDRLIKANAKQIGGIDRSNGLMAEEAVYNALSKDNIFANIKFDEMHKNVPIMSGFKTMTELDILMVNGDTIALIETKYKAEKKDVNKMLTNKLPYFKQYFPKYSNHKIILGVGGMGFEDGAEEEAKENGIGIIKVIGDKVEFYTENIKEY